MTSSAAYTVSPSISLLLITPFSLMGVCAWALLGVFTSAGKVGWVLFVLPAALFIYYFELSSHSRLASIYIFSFLGVIVFSRSKLRWLLVFSSLIGIGFSLIYALGGRGSGAHGLLTVAGNIEGMSIDKSLDLSVAAFLNLMQGIFLTGDGMMITAHFQDRYEILSFSPLPAFMDGFKSVLECCQIRIHAFIPMSAIAELSHFSPIYWIFASIFFWITLRVAAKSFRPGSGFMVIATNLLIFIAFIIANAYPVRTVFRIFLLMLVAIIVSRSAVVSKFFLIRKHGIGRE